MASSNATVAGGSALVALLPPIGPRVRWVATQAVLKVAPGHVLRVQRSSLVFTGERGAEVGVLDEAFGLRAGMQLDGPFYEFRRDERARPAAAVAMTWVLDGVGSVQMPLVNGRADAGHPVLWCMPLHVPLKDDRQLFVQFVNTRAQSVDLVAAICTATLWVDGGAHASQTGQHWDGRGDVQPGGTARYGFRLSDFEGAPLLGSHELSLDIFGERTSPQRVLFSGEPWVALPPGPSAPFTR